MLLFLTVLLQPISAVGVHTASAATALAFSLSPVAQLLPGTQCVLTCPRKHPFCLHKNGFHIAALLTRSLQSPVPTSTSWQCRSPTASTPLQQLEGRGLGCGMPEPLGAAAFAG